MKHGNEVWQEYDRRGEKKRNGGIKPGDKIEGYFAGVAVILYRYRQDNVEYLFQQRSKKIKDNPNVWDVSAGGHINYNENKINAVVREATEEIGAKLDPEKIEFASTYITAPGHGIVSAYFYDWTDKEDRFEFVDSEVQAVKWVAVKDLEKFREKLKIPLQNDENFFLNLRRWTKKINQKYGNCEFKNSVKD